MNLIRKLNELVKCLKDDYVQDAIEIDWFYLPSINKIRLEVDHPLVDYPLCATVTLLDCSPKGTTEALKILNTIVKTELDKINFEIREDYKSEE